MADPEDKKPKLRFDPNEREAAPAAPPPPPQTTPVFPPLPDDCLRNVFVAHSGLFPGLPPAKASELKARVKAALGTDTLVRSLEPHLSTPDASDFAVAYDAREARACGYPGPLAVEEDVMQRLNTTGALTMLREANAKADTVAPGSVSGMPGVLPHHDPRWIDSPHIEEAFVKAYGDPGGTVPYTPEGYGPRRGGNSRY